ncbi:MAG: hypothetical protein ACTHW7_14690, partial [Actinomycetaceae bacterium]
GISALTAAVLSVPNPYPAPPAATAPAISAPTPAAPGTVPPPAPDVPSEEPSTAPAPEPTTEPPAVDEPSEDPTDDPTVAPSESATDGPTEEPMDELTEEPTTGPAEEPTPPVLPDPLVLQLAPPVDSSGFFAPVLTGTTRPGSQVAVELDGTRYAVTPDADGSWTFDMTGLRHPTGTHEYRAWAFTDEERSTAVEARFTVVPLSVSGIRGLELLTIDRASSSGMTVDLSGPAGGQVCIASGSGASTTVTLDPDGRASGRITFTSVGLYTLSIAPCRDAGSGATVYGADRESIIVVADPAGRSQWSWWPGPAHVQFDLPTS